MAIGLLLDAVDTVLGGGAGALFLPIVQETIIGPNTSDFEFTSKVEFKDTFDSRCNNCYRRNCVKFRCSPITCEKNGIKLKLIY